MNSNRRSRLWSRSASIRSRTAGRACDGVISRFRPGQKKAGDDARPSACRVPCLACYSVILRKRSPVDANLGCSRPRDRSARRPPFHRQVGPIRQAPRRPALPVASVRGSTHARDAERGPSAWCQGGRRPGTGALVVALIIAKAIGSRIRQLQCRAQCRRIARRLGKCRAKTSFWRENSRTTPSWSAD
jgi:hypothetical protein